MIDSQADNGVIVLGPGEGRAYDCGAVQAVFKADEGETASRYSVSEWWVEANHMGAHPHSHDANEELFFVIQGTMTFQVAGEDVQSPAGTFIRIPAGVMHGFENRSSERAGVLNVFIPGGFEARMPAIAGWYAANPQSPLVAENERAGSRD
jgi:mannose-6-phosphate isomerase-like protein (cupin superfamily)